MASNKVNEIYVRQDERVVRPSESLRFYRKDGTSFPFSVTWVPAWGFFRVPEGMYSMSYHRSFEQALYRVLYNHYCLETPLINETTWECAFYRRIPHCVHFSKEMDDKMKSIGIFNIRESFDPATIPGWDVNFELQQYIENQPKEFVAEDLQCIEKRSKEIVKSNREFRAFLKDHNLPG